MIASFPSKVKIPLVSQRFASAQSGQVLILGMVLMVVAALTILATFNTGRVVNDKTQLVNAADAAVYSAGVNVARQLNFLAYTNRAMMANHVAVGHVVSYTAWARSVSGLSENIAGASDALDEVVPGNLLSSFGSLLSGALGRGADLADVISPLYIAYTQGLIYSQSVAQKATFDALSGADPELEALSDSTMKIVTHLHELDFYKDKSIHKTMYVNNLEHLQYIQNRVDAAAQRKLASIRSDIENQNEKVMQFLNYDEMGDVDVVYDMAEKSIDALASKNWFQDRGWQLGSLNRSGSTTQVTENGRINWVASDRYTAAGNELAKGDANADTLCREANRVLSTSRLCVDGYTGFAQHYSINSVNPADAKLRLSTFLSKSLDDRFIENDHYDQSTDQENRQYVSAVSSAEIYFERPCGDQNCQWGFSDSPQEQPNLYNPFWRARLVQ